MARKTPGIYIAIRGDYSAFETDLNAAKKLAKVQGDAIAKSYAFANYYETMAFVNALALIAHQQDHHPDLTVSYGRCGVRRNTHDVNGISSTDIECARRIDALLERP